MGRGWMGSNATSVARKSARRKALDIIKRERGCVDCGTREGNLHFDHRPGETKLFGVSAGASHSWALLSAEIAKCDVRCASCHARRHRASQVGEDAMHVKLTEAQVLAIRAVRKSQRQIAREFGITQANVSRIIRRETWRHI